MNENETSTVDKPAGNSWKDTHPEIGALWIKEGKGQKFMSGYVEVGGEKKRVIVYSNKYKDQNPNSPDFRMYLSLSDGASSSPAVDAFDSLGSTSQASEESHAEDEDLL